MNQHTNDTFGNEASRAQDALPIERVEHPLGETERASADDLAELRDLAQQAVSQDASSREQGVSTTASGRLGVPQERAPLSPSDALRSLEDQGFTEEEAHRLIAITGRLEESPEARESEATLRRLRFTRWLVEQGRLDEWSA